MCRAVAVYFDHITETRDEWMLDGYTVTVLVEQRVTPLAMLADDLWGTSDCTIIGRKPGVLRVRVVDYKHGRGKPVDLSTPAGRGQLLVYMVGALNGPARPQEKDTLVLDVAIVQPRCPKVEPVQVLPVTVAEFEAFRRGLVDAAQAALGRSGRPNPPPAVCGEWCDWCKGKENCPKWKAQAADLLGSDFIDAPPALPAEDAKPLELAKETSTDAEKLGRLLTLAPSIRDALDKAEEAALAMLAAGTPVPGHKRVLGRPGNRDWCPGIEPVQVVELLDGLGLDLPADQSPVEIAMESPALRSPAQLEAAVKKALGKASKGALAKISKCKPLQALIVRRDPQPTLAPESDPRPALEPDQGKEKMLAADFADPAATPSEVTAQEAAPAEDCW
jgi:hypothetical protein